MTCPDCGGALEQHPVTPMWRCMNPHCKSFDRWKARFGKPGFHQRQHAKRKETA